MTAMMDAPPVRGVPKASPLQIMGDRFNIEPAKLIEVLKGTVIKATDKHTPTNEEVAAFVMVANQYGLNPFTREIHAFADPRRGVVPIVGIDGWARIVNEEPRFDGCEFDYQVDEKGKPIATTCTMHVKGRSHPVSVTEFFAECFRPTEPWKGMPNRMLRHKAFMQAARIAFSLSGLFDEDEVIDVAGFKTVVNEAQASGSRTEVLAQRISNRPAPQLEASPDAQDMSVNTPQADAVDAPAEEQASDTSPTQEEQSPGMSEAERIVNTFAEAKGVMVADALAAVNAHTMKFYKGKTIDKLSPKELKAVASSIASGDIVIK